MTKANCDDECQLDYYNYRKTSCRTYLFKNSQVKLQGLRSFQQTLEDNEKKENYVMKPNQHKLQRTADAKQGTASICWSVFWVTKPVPAKCQFYHYLHCLDAKTNILVTNGV
ncbi:unnamed protein product [Clavelina lepadiformis]|uniref:Uncharacterized protein n=1 Tax=Clavelina lepadiformis TaxID=159417 RepID=A0ABP0EZT8_CLALP